MADTRTKIAAQDALLGAMLERLTATADGELKAEMLTQIDRVEKLFGVKPRRPAPSLEIPAAPARQAAE